MKYENTTYKLAAYIGTLEKVAERRAQYLADSEKVTKDLSIYSDEYKKAHEEDARGKLNTAFLTDMLKYRGYIDKLNTELLEAFINDTKPKADVSMAVFLCMRYIDSMQAKADKNYFKQLATPVYEAGDLRGLKELVTFYSDTVGPSKGPSGSGSIPFGNVHKEVGEMDEFQRQLDLLCEKACELFPAANDDIESRAQAQPISGYGQSNSLMEYAKQIKAKINGEVYTPVASGVFSFNFTKVRNTL